MEAKLNEILQNQKENSAEVLKIKENTKKFDEYKKTLDTVALSVNSIGNKLCTLTTNVSTLEKTVSDLEKKLTQKYITLEKKVNDIEESRQFDSNTIDNVKQRQDTITLQEAVLKEKVDELSNQLRSLKISHNLETQYNKSCKHVKVVGLPYQQGEEGHTINANKQCKVSRDHY